MSDTDHCNPFGIERPTSTAQAIRAFLALRELVKDDDQATDLVEWGLDACGYREPEYAEHDDWQKDTEGNWGQAFAGALGSDTAPVCWSCGKAERVGDYCKACLSMQ